MYHHAGVTVLVCIRFECVLANHRTRNARVRSGKALPWPRSSNRDTGTDWAEQHVHCHHVHLLLGRMNVCWECSIMAIHISPRTLYICHGMLFTMSSPISTQRTILVHTGLKNIGDPTSGVHNIYAVNQPMTKANSTKFHSLSRVLIKRTLSTRY